MTTHTVKQGDCISSIADKNGFFCNTIWNHANNAQLKKERKDPNTLLPGDKVFVPEKEIGSHSGGTEKKHSFRLLGVPAKMKIRLLINDEPRTKTKYRLYVDSKLLSEGTSDGDGYIKESIMPNVKNGKLVILDEDNNEEYYPFNFGTLDPVDNDDGIKERLFNLGYDVSDLSLAIGEFQRKYELKETLINDNSTKNKLTEVFGQ